MESVRERKRQGPAPTRKEEEGVVRERSMPQFG